MKQKYDASRQDYEKYTEEDREVWRRLYERQIVNLPGAASKEYIDGIQKIGFTADKIPNFEEMNKILRKLTGWEVAVVPGLIPEKDFFELLSEKKFPASTWFRKLSELDYLEEPDMFHDVFGHVPLLTNASFVGFLQSLSDIALKYIDNPYAIELISRLYWFSVEFGLIRENGELRIYGAGILSSAGETEYSLKGDPKYFDYDVRQMLLTPFRKDVFQDRYFIIDSYKQLYQSSDDIAKILAEEVQKHAA
jgi:phenylalanine-4-hydroxylase